MTPNSYLQLGTELLRHGDWEEAIQAFCQAIQLDPNYGLAYNNLGLILMDTNRLLEAEACFRRAVELNPEDSYAYNNLGMVLTDIGYPQKAEDCFLRAIELKPSFPQFYNNLGVVLEELHRYDDAEKAYRQAIFFDVAYCEAYFNLGTLYRGVKRFEEAKECLLQALAVRPGYLDAELALALLHLLQANFKRGWSDYEVVRRRKYGYMELGIPDWKGEALTGRNILLFWEYGLGDTLQFVRYAQKVRELAGNTALLVQEPLARLIRDAYPDLPVYTGDDLSANQYDCACSLLNLPLLFATENETVPQPVAYGDVLHEVAGCWHEKLKAIHSNKGLRVGVVWAGHPYHANDRKRSIPFAVFQNLFSVSNVTWISLQAGNRGRELAGTKYSVLDFSQEFTDFMETAGLIENLDLVITVDTAVAHLAGTMGKPTWVLLSYDPDWRWQIDREDSPWYSGMRLFRQNRLGDWDELVERVKTALKEFVGVVFDL